MLATAGAEFGGAGQGRTKVLNILISEEANVTTGRAGAALCAGALGLVDDDTVCEGSGDKGSSVGELGHAAVVVHAKPRKAISDGGEDQCEVTIGTEVSDCSHPLCAGAIGLRRQVARMEGKPQRSCDKDITYPANQATVMRKSSC